MFDSWISSNLFYTISWRSNIAFYKELSGRNSKYLDLGYYSGYFTIFSKPWAKCLPCHPSLSRQQTTVTADLFRGVCWLNHQFPVDRQSTSINSLWKWTCHVGRHDGDSCAKRRPPFCHCASRFPPELLAYTCVSEMRSNWWLYILKLSLQLFSGASGTHFFRLVAHVGSMTCYSPVGKFKECLCSLADLRGLFLCCSKHFSSTPIFCINWKLQYYIIVFFKYN